MSRRIKNPYVNLTLSQVKDAEERYFYLQVGDEIPIYNNKHTFSKDMAEELFYELMESLRHMKDNGNQRDRVDAHRLPLSLGT